MACFLTWPAFIRDPCIVKKKMQSFTERKLICKRSQEENVNVSDGFKDLPFLVRVPRHMWPASTEAQLIMYNNNNCHKQQFTISNSCQLDTRYLLTCTYRAVGKFLRAKLVVEPPG